MAHYTRLENGQKNPPPLSRLGSIITGYNLNEEEAELLRRYAFEVRGTSGGRVVKDTPNNLDTMNVAEITETTEVIEESNFSREQCEKDSARDKMIKEVIAYLVEPENEELVEFIWNIQNIDLKDGIWKEMTEFVQNMR